jgi:hypothetical protein
MNEKAELYESPLGQTTTLICARKRLTMASKCLTRKIAKAKTDQLQICRVWLGSNVPFAQKRSDVINKAQINR